MLYSLLDPDNTVEIMIIMRSELEVKLLQNGTSRIYMAAILKRVIHTSFISSLSDSLTRET